MAKKKAVKESSESKEKPKRATAAVRDYALFQSPIITEKTSVSGGDRSKIVFRVRRDATKPEIREAVERVFGVEVAAVKTCNVLGKIKRTMRSAGRRPSFKKAYVILKPGHKIDVVEGV